MDTFPCHRRDTGALHCDGVSHSTYRQILCVRVHGSEYDGCIDGGVYFWDWGIGDGDICGGAGGGVGQGSQGIEVPEKYGAVTHETSW